MDYTDRNFMIFNVSEIDKINFNEVLESSTFLLRKSVNNQKTLVKWDGNIIPTCVTELTTKEGHYNYDEITNILISPEWTDYNSKP